MIRNDDQDNGIQLIESPNQIAFNALENLKILEWGKTTISEKTDLIFATEIFQKRNEIISLLETLSNNHPNASVRKKLKTNVKNLTNNIKYRFNTEGANCKCGIAGCFRSVYSSQLYWMGHSAKGFVAQSARCFDGSKELYNVASSIRNSEVSFVELLTIDESRKGGWYNLPSLQSGTKR